MRTRTLKTAMAAGLLLVASTASAQTAVTTITFTLPVNLAQLPPELTRVRLVCAISRSAVLVYDPYMSTAVSDFDVNVLPKDELPVVSGQLVATLTVAYPIMDGWIKPQAIGQPADYECRLFGFSTSQQAWDMFSATAKWPEFRINPAPAPIKASFTW